MLNFFRKLKVLFFFSRLKENAWNKTAQHEEQRDAWKKDRSHVCKSSSVAAAKGMTMSALALIALLCLCVGVAAGFLAGLFGIGGGMIMVAALAFVLPALGAPAAHVMHMALATSLACIVLTALASTRAHHRRGAVAWTNVFWLAPGLVIGGLVGALLAGALPDAWLRIGFAVYCFITAITLFAARKEAGAGIAAAPAGPLLSLIAVPVGALSALVGIGGGSMLVPILIHRGDSAVRAVATSAACGIAVAIASASGYVMAANETTAPLPWGSIGYVHAPTALLLAIGSTSATRYGAALAHKLAHQALSRAFALLLFVFGALMVIDLLR